MSLKATRMTRIKRIKTDLIRVIRVLYSQFTFTSNILCGNQTSICPEPRLFQV